MKKLKCAYRELVNIAIGQDGDGKWYVQTSDKNQENIYSEVIQEGLDSYAHASIIAQEYSRDYNLDIVIWTNNKQESVMNSLEKLKSKMLFDILTNEVEYSFDENYNNSLTYSERVNGFRNVLKFLAEKDLFSIIENYGKELFLDSDLYSSEEKDLIKKM